MMSIRRARAAEADLLSAIAVRAKAHWGYSPEELHAWREGLRIAADEIRSNPTFVGEVDGAPAGFYSLVPGRDAWTLNHLWVLPSSMRRGCGRALLHHAVDTARAGGALSIAIDSDPNAESFYVECGATRQGEIRAPIADDPQRVRPQLVIAIARSSPAHAR